MYRVLLICKDNSALSAIAEGYFNMFAGDMAEIYSAGLHPKRIPAEVIKLMKEDNIDISGIIPHYLIEYRHIDFDYILTFDSESENESHHLPSKSVKYHFDFDRLLLNEEADQSHADIYRNIKEKIKKTVRGFVKEHLAMAKAD
jgi:arsenate reductase